MTTDNRNNGTGSIHLYEFAPDSWTPIGWCLHPLTDPAAAADDLADVVVSHERTAYGNTWHTTIRMRASESLYQRRPDVLVRARAMLADR